MTINEIKVYLEQYFEQVELVGNGDNTIDGPAKIDDAVEGNVSFVANDKYNRYIGSTNASLLIVGKHAPIAKYSDRLSFLKVKDPYTAFVFVLQRFSVPQVIAEPGIDPTAIIGQNVTFGRNVAVGAYAVIGDNCDIGDNTVIGPHTVIMAGVIAGKDCCLYPGVVCYDGAILGDRVTIHSGTVVGADGFGFAPQPDGSYVKIPQIGNVEIKDDVEIGANNTIDRATMGSTVIEKGVKIDNLVQIAHNCTIGENTVIASQAGISGSARIGKNCMIGGQAGFFGHISLADKIQVAGKAVVTKSMHESGQILRGMPAQPIRDQLRQEAMLRNLDSMKKKLDALEAEVRGRSGQ